MQTILQTMLTVWEQVKQSGSYSILFLLAVLLLVHKHKEKYKWTALYVLAGFFLVSVNPIMVMISGKVFPALNIYVPFLLFIPVLFYIPLAGLELVNGMWEEKKRYLILVLLIMLVGVSGSFFGVASPIYKQPHITKEQEEIIAVLDEKKAQNILAEDEILPFIQREANNCKCLYGRDLWTPNMDLGIMDEYDPELVGLYEAMKNPKDTWKDIVQTATMYECDYIVIKYYKNYPAYEGNYRLIEKTQNYLVYEWQEVS